MDNKNDSLLKMFSSEYFTDEMLIQYYYKYIGKPGTHDYLTNKLYEMDPLKIEVYVPFLCYMLIRNHSKLLERYLVDLSGKNFNIFLLLFWCTHAFSFTDRQIKEKQQRIDIIERSMEMSMVNNIEVDFEESNKEEAMLMRFQQKQHLSNYYNQVVRFVASMFRFSLTLKQFPKEDAQHHLRLFIQKLKIWINGLRASLPKVPQFHGVALPLSQWMDDKPLSRMVVNVIDDYHQCFHTKNRVPFMIILECIDQRDLLTQKQQLREQSNIEQEQVPSDEKLEKLEKQMQEMVHDKQQCYHDALEKIVKYEQKGKRQSYIMEKMSDMVPKVAQQNQNVKSKQKISLPLNLRRMNSWPNQNQTVRMRKLSDIPITYPFVKTQAFHEELIKKYPQKEFFLQTQLVALFKKQRNEDTSHSSEIWETTWEELQEKIRRASPYGHFPSYKLRPIIVKGGDDLRQELLVLQMMTGFQKIFNQSQLKLQLRPYAIVITSANSGLVEFIPNTISIDALKKRLGGGTKTLYQIYKQIFERSFEEAQKNFIESLAAYSLFTYFMNVKDRHNGNLLIDNSGRLIHIDFGFVLGCSPGNINFETAPFKLTQEYVELMKGKDSDFFGYFRTLLIRGMFELKKYVNDLQYSLLIMRENSDLPCFKNFDFKAWRSRFMEGATDKECIDNVDRIIYSSLYNWRTAQYDNFQKITNGIIP